MSPSREAPLSFAAIGDDDGIVTCLYGYLEVPFSRLVAVFGEPGPGDGCRTAFEWRLRFSDGTVATIYDYRVCVVHADSDSPTPSDLRQHDFANWHVGGNRAAALQLVREAIESHVNHVGDSVTCSDSERRTLMSISAIEAPSLAFRVDRVFKECLYKSSEIVAGSPPEEAVLVEGIDSRFAFHPQRIASYKAEITALIDELPDNFRRSKGGGWTFLNLCLDKHGSQWGEHADCQALLALAIATEQGGYCLPRDMWSVLPGGMPFVWVGR